MRQERITMSKGKLVHTRKIEINTFDLGDHRILVEGELEDTRRPPSSAEESGTGPFLVHHLVARFWVQGPDLTISAVDAEMKRIPRAGVPRGSPGSSETGRPQDHHGVYPEGERPYRECQGLLSSDQSFPHPRSGCRSGILGRIRKKARGQVPG